MNSLIRMTILMTLLSGSAISALAQASATTGSSISGRVMIGSNPAPGLVVGAQRSDTNNFSSSEPAAKATTDQSGRYQITGLTAGRYRVMSLSSVYVVPGENQITPLSGKTTTLNENDQAENVDFSVVRGAVITGKVTDADGRPLIGERVTLTSIDSQGRKRQMSSFIDFTMYEIDDRGVYRVFGLPAGRYTVSAGQASDGSSIRIGFGGPTYRRTFHPNVIEEEQAKIIELEEGQEVGNVDIAVGRPVKTFEATGRIVSAETGQPMPSMMYGYGGLRPGMSRPTSYGSSGTVTNIRGEFRIENLLPGRYAAFLFNGSGFGMGDAGADYYSDPVPFEIVEGNVSGLEIKVHRGGSIAGAIVAEDGNNQALLSQTAQVIVFANPVMTGAPGAAPPRPPMPSAPNRVQPDGSFRIGGLTPGKLRLSLSSPGLQVVRIEREGIPFGEGTIELAPGEQISGLRLIVSYGTGVVRGEVKIIGGTLPQGSRLLVSARRITGTGMPTPGPSAEADARGFFMLEKLPPGEYEVTARAMQTPNISFSMTTTSGTGSSTVTMTTSGDRGTGTGAPPTPPPAMPTAKQNVTVTNGNAAQVTLTLDLSEKK